MLKFLVVFAVCLTIALPLYFSLELIAVVCLLAMVTCWRLGIFRRLPKRSSKKKFKAYNPGVSIAFFSLGALSGAWYVQHSLSNTQTSDRSNQSQIIDFSKERALRQNRRV